MDSVQIKGNKMKKSRKRIVGWGSGAGISITFVAMTFVLILSVNSGSMKSLDGQPMMDIVNITPHAGGDTPEAPENKGCGSHIEWIGQKVNNSALRKTGKPFRVLPPNSMMTMDHNPERINVHVDEHGIIEDVKCG